MSRHTNLRSSASRRRFLQAAGAGGALWILPSGARLGAAAPSNKLNIALIGVYGRGRAHWDAIGQENVVALCDVYQPHLALAAKRFPRAKHYEDWRRCLDQRDLDAVVCCTPDHHHAFVAVWAMNRGLHVYMEKPLGCSVEEARLVRRTYLKNRHKLATQNGTQRHAKPNFNRVSELVRDGAVGRLQAVYAWGDRQIRRDGYLPAAGDPPPTLNWDLWLGPAPYHPYNPGYYGGDHYRPGMNCLNWNMYWDFGTGQVGDMGSHTMDLAWNALDADLPTAAAAHGDPFDPEVTPVELTATFDIPANAWRGPITVSWLQGGAMPKSPRPYVDLNKIGHGAMFQGDKGWIIASFDNRIIVPEGDGADMTYYRPRRKEQLLPPLGGFQQEWIDACKGDLRTTCNFDYAGRMTETLMLGLAAYRAGAKLRYDGKSGRVTNNEAANELLHKPYRKGWVLNG